jgi:hypothetical protein
MRPWLTEISISGILGIPIIVGNTFYFPHPVLPNEDYYLVFNPAFWQWSKGAFQLSAVVSEYYHVFAGDPTHYPVDFSLTWVRPTLTHGFVIHNIPFGVSTPPNYFALPGNSEPYWYYGSEA